jgi:nitroimidazol reductase NimA-like FMN-containing flavoprotein (pyridoxamine 5'-phosphate oxidase superfamily)
MKEKAIGILDQNRLMAIATLQANGWPQNTMVSYANEDILIYFIISRQSQKFANIERDDRVSTSGATSTTQRRSRPSQLPREPQKSRMRSSGSAPSDSC